MQEKANPYPEYVAIPEKELLALPGKKGPNRVNFFPSLCCWQLDIQQWQSWSVGINNACSWHSLHPHCYGHLIHVSIMPALGLADDRDWLSANWPGNFFYLVV